MATADRLSCEHTFHFTAVVTYEARSFKTQAEAAERIQAQLQTDRQELDQELLARQVRCVSFFFVLFVHLPHVRRVSHGCITPVHAPPLFLLGTRDGADAGAP